MVPDASVRPARPRIAPLAADELTDEQRALLGNGGPNGPLDILRVFVRHPSLFSRWVSLAHALLAKGRLTARDRELVVLRVAWRCRSAYEWGQHVALARQAGLADDEIRAVAAPLDAADWAPADRDILVAADELLHDHCIGDATWARLATRLDTTQLVELPVLVGQYSLVAGAVNSWGVQPEPGRPPLGEV